MECAQSRVTNIVLVVVPPGNLIINESLLDVIGTTGAVCLVIGALKSTMSMRKMAVTGRVETSDLRRSCKDLRNRR